MADEVTQKNEMLGWLNAPFSSYLASMGQILGKPYQQYQGQTVAGPSVDTQAGWQLGRNAAMDNTAYNGAMNQYMNTLNGSYMPQQSNPYLDGMIQQAQGDVTNAYQRGTAAQTDSAAARARALGSSGYNEQVANNQYQLGQNLGQIENQFRFQDYNMQNQNAQAERNRQQSAMSMLPQMQNASMFGSNQLQNIGNQNNAYQQGLLTQGAQDWSQANAYPTQWLNQFQNSLFPLMGAGTKTTTSGMDQGGNGFASLLGAGLTAAGMFNPQSWFGGNGGTSFSNGIKF